MCFHDNNKSAKSLGLSALRLHFRETTCPHGHITTAQPPEETSVQGSQNKRPAVIKWQDNNVRTFLLTRCPPNLLKYFVVFASGFHLIPQSENKFHFGAMGINSTFSANLSNGMDLQLIQFTLNIFTNNIDSRDKTALHFPSANNLLRG